jgi:hypothetical protein
MIEPKKPRRTRKPAPAPAAAPDAPERAARRRDLTLKLYALAGKPERADEFEALRLELDSLR